VIESFHLLALAVIGGSVLVVNLRLCGVGLKREPVDRLWNNALPWLVGSYLTMIASGLLMFTSEAVKLYYHEAFWFKMASLLLATVFTLTIVRPVALAGGSPVRERITGIVSLALWTGVGVGGRWIGFS
jgi:hypothetical protein